MADSQTNAFVTTLNELGSGEALTDLHEALTGLISDVLAIGKSGELTLTLKVGVPTKSSTARMLLTTYEVKTKSPKPDKSLTVLYVDDSLKVSRRDPRQPMLPGAGPAEVRKFAVNEESN